ncbi:MAG: hypothetical protein ACTH9T_02690 [Mycetocola reblochoni]|uniref:hypothetical protein n=1 Tax=Mycetocola reblochoni TaxID=331618 RepID=UPI00117CDE62|nr:hypothetical protein [Mycetocola reblochoni]
MSAGGSDARATAAGGTATGGTATGGSATGGPAAAERDAVAPQRRAAVVAAVVVCAGLSVALVLLGLAVVPTLLGGGAPPRVGEVSASADGAFARFDWDDPGLAEGDRYLVTVDDGEQRVQDGTGFVVDGVPGSRLCVTVQVERGDELSAAGEPSCVEIPAGVD